MMLNSLLALRIFALLLLISPSDSAAQQPVVRGHGAHQQPPLAAAAPEGGSASLAALGGTKKLLLLRVGTIAAGLAGTGYTSAGAAAAAKIDDDGLPTVTSAAVEHESGDFGAATGQLGISAKSFGARGNCTVLVSSKGRPSALDSCVDDGPALQRAIEAARLQRRSLLLAAGTYMVLAPLEIHCSVSNTGCGRPFKLVGEGIGQTTIVPGAPMSAVIKIVPGAVRSGVIPGDKYNATQNGHEFSGFSITGLENVPTAVYGISAPSITRSVFRDIAVSFVGTGMQLGFGWCIRVEDCDLSSNTGLGLHLKSAVNNLEVTGSNIEGNHAGGIVIVDGAQVNIEGNNIEGNGETLGDSTYLSMSDRYTLYIHDVHILQGGVCVFAWKRSW